MLERRGLGLEVVATGSVDDTVGMATELVTHSRHNYLSW
jgi:hypothetical protein